MLVRLAFVGDSFINGVGDPDCLGWVGRVCAMARERGTDVTVYNLGVRRETSADIARRWLAEVTPRQAADDRFALLFSFGVNDCVLEDRRPRVGFDESLSHCRAILTRARGMAPCLMVGPPPIADAAVNGRIAALGQGFAGVAAELSVPFLPVFAPLSAALEWRDEVAQGDGAHPGRAGYALLAAMVDGWPAWRRVLSS